MPLTTATKKAVLDHYYGKISTWTQQDNLWIGLSSTTPAADGSNFTEPVNGAAFKDGYSRVQVANSNVNWEDATLAEPSVKANKTEIEFAACADNAWPEVTHWGIFIDNTPATDPVDWAILSPAKTVGVGDVAKFAAGELKTRLQNP